MERSKYLQRMLIGCRRRSRTFGFGVKVRRVAVYTILQKDSGHWESNPEPCASPALTPLIRRLLYRLSYAPLSWSRRKDSNLRRSIIDRVHCRLCYTAMVDPAGLKPAPHGLKGRCSVARAPDRKNGCGGRTRTFDNRINSPAPYQLGYATREWLREQESNLR